MKSLFERMADVQSIPAPANEDRLPHNRAVWRETLPTPAEQDTWLQVSVDYGDGLIEQTRARLVQWAMVKRWRWGWGPSA